MPPAHSMQLRLSEDAHKRLQNMRNLSDAASYAEVIRDSLRIYEWLLKQKLDGYEIALIKDGQPVKKIELLT